MSENQCDECAGLEIPCSACRERARIQELHARPDLARLSRCRICGLEIAADLEPLCCQHRYGKKILNDREDDIEDLVEAITKHEGERITRGFQMING